MKSLLIIIFCSFITFTNAQNRIELSENKVTQLIFPDAIKDHKGGFLPSDILIETKGNIIYIQPVGGFVETNLNVTTENEVYYSFDLIYNQHCNIFNYVIKEDQAFYNANVNPSKSGNQKKKDELQSDTSIIVGKIKRHSGNIYSRNGIRDKKMEILLKGIYIHKNDLFFKVELTNGSNIAYDIDLLNFIVKGKKTKSMSTQESVQITPKNVFKDDLEVKPNKSMTVIFQFEKFNIGDQKKLFIELYEKQGERNISLYVDTYYILNAEAI